MCECGDLFFLSEAKETERLRLTKGIRAALFEKKQPEILDAWSAENHWLNCVRCRLFGNYSNFFSSSMSGSALRNRSGISLVALC